MAKIDSILFKLNFEMDSQIIVYRLICTTWNNRHNRNCSTIKNKEVNMIMPVLRLFSF